MTVPTEPTDPAATMHAAHGPRSVRARGSAATTNPRHEVVRAFFVGALTPAAAPTLGAIIIASFLLLFSCLFLSESRFARMNPGYFMNDVEDEYPKLVHDVLKVARGPSEPISVTIIGDSSIREAISSQEHLEELLRQKVGRRVAVHILAAGGLSHWEAVGLIDRVRLRSRGVIVAEVSPSVLALRPTLMHEWGAVRFPLDSRALRELLVEMNVEPPPNRHSFFLNHAGFFSSRSYAVVRHLLAGPEPTGLHMVESKPPWDATHWKLAYEHIYLWHNGYDGKHLQNLAVYRRMMDLATERHRWKFVMLEATSNPLVHSPHYAPPNEAEMERRYKRDVRGFCRQNHIPYWELDSEAGLQASDFLDYIHVHSPRARIAYTNVLASRIAECLVEPASAPAKDTTSPSMEPLP